MERALRPPEYRKADTMVQSTSKLALSRGIPTIRTADAPEVPGPNRCDLQAILGDFRARTPLTKIAAGSTALATPSRIFESRPRYYVTANVYVPSPVNGPHPAVLCPVGHWGAGKFRGHAAPGAHPPAAASSC
jgi:hypothetical protein